MEKPKIAVIGSGPGGIASAVKAAELGAEVFLIEDEKLGGVCLNEGCIPTKTLLASAKRFLEVKEAENFGINVSPPTINWLSMFVRKENVVKELQEQLNASLRQKRIKVIYGRAIFETPKRLLVKTKTGENKLEVDKIIISTGSLPLKLAGIENCGKAIITPGEALNLKALPKKLIIIGGGPTGVEFANLFSVLGVKVVLIEVLENILAAEDSRIGQIISQILKKQRVEILTNTSFKQILSPGQNLAVVKLDAKKEFLAERVLVAVGRVPNTKNLGLEKIGLAVDTKGFISVNEKMETNLEGIYAVGDVTGKMMLAHYASKSGQIAVENAMNSNLKINTLTIPRCIYTIPETASVGLNKKEAESQNLEVKIGRAYFQANGLAQATGKTSGFFQLVVEMPSQKILGCQIVGEGAVELVHPIALAIKQRLKVKDLDDIIFAHPAFSEIIKEVAKNAK